jgi:hypothetical protein
MRALRGCRPARPGLLPGLMRLVGAASVTEKQARPGSKVARARITPGA